MQKPAKKALLLIVAILVSAPLIMEAYTRWSPAFSAEMPAPKASTKRLILLFHGSGGKDNPAMLQLEQALSEKLTANDSEVIRYVWSPWSDGRLRASTNGLYLGEKIGAHLANQNIRELHLIGHSAGAWLPDAVCASLRKYNSEPVKVRMTFLDPIGIKGFLDFDWGSQNFGGCADFAEAIINTNDNVPGTNEPLQRAFNIDVTELPHDMNGHEWPVWYYTQTLNGMSLSMDANHFEMPRGAVAKDVTASAD
jgi:hypothetical protein